jgi:wyosine [tRNA(Phe)-imidazoG37] synthetase (radical SAM superfamily)
MRAFGPIPSRRLGRSLGINNIPPKSCTYACVYCQVGRTLKMQTRPRRYYRPESVIADVRKKVGEVRRKGESIDYLTFVPDGEPTLDLHLGSVIDVLRSLGIKIAVITNSSLIWREDVRNSLLKADWVSLKLDAGDESTWHKINRPHCSLDFGSIVEGIKKFAGVFKGDLVTETLLVRDVNDSRSQAEEVADLLTQIRPGKAYLAIPTRPPAETWVQRPEEGVLNAFYQVLRRKFEMVEYLIAYEGNQFTSTGNVEESLLGITAVHPMREEAVRQFLDQANTDQSVVQRMISEGLLCKTEFENSIFYVRRYPAK